MELVKRQGPGQEGCELRQLEVRRRITFIQPVHAHMSRIMRAYLALRALRLDGLVY